MTAHKNPRQLVDPLVRFERLHRKQPDGCWTWIGTLPRGYGQLRIIDRARRTQRSVQAHRFAYENFVGPIPDGLDLDHLCRNRACVNPAHLEPVTRSENLRRGDQAKLSASDRAEILADPRMEREIAADYGVSRSTVHYVKKPRLRRPRINEEAAA